MRQQKFNCVWTSIGSLNDRMIACSDLCVSASFRSRVSAPSVCYHCLLWMFFLDKTIANQAFVTSTGIQLRVCLFCDTFTISFCFHGNDVMMMFAVHIAFIVCCCTLTAVSFDVSVEFVTYCWVSFFIVEWTYREFIFLSVNDYRRSNVVKNIHVCL